MSRGADDRSYVRAVEAAWSRVLGRPAVVSPREFETIDAWRKRGVPLSVVLEVIDAAGKRPSGRGPKALTRLNHEVLAAWEVVAAGRATPRDTEALPPRSDARRAWEEALSRVGEEGPLRDVLAALLAEDRRGADAAALDAALDASLPSAVSGDALKRATDETARALQEFRGRMRDEEFRKMFSRALVDRLREALSLPRLTLTR